MTDTKKDQGGRPSNYREEYCEDIITFMGKGFSKTAFAGHIGVCRQTILNWTSQHPEFLGAVKRAEAARVTFLEERLINGDTGPRVTSHIFALKNADPDEWRDKREHGFTDRDGNDLSFAVNFVNAPDSRDT